MTKRKLPEINPSIDEVKNKTQTKRKGKNKIPKGESVYIPPEVLAGLRNVESKDNIQPYIEENGALVVRQTMNIRQEDEMKDQLNENELSVEEQIRLLLNPDTQGDVIEAALDSFTSKLSIFTSNKEHMDKLNLVLNQLKEPLVYVLSELGKDKEVLKLLKNLDLSNLMNKPLTKEDVLKIVEGKFATKKDVKTMVSNIEVNAGDVTSNNNDRRSKSSVGFFKSIKNEVEGWFESDDRVDVFNFRVEKEDLVESEFMKDLTKRLRDSGVEPKYL